MIKYIILFLLICTPCYGAGMCDNANNQGCYLMEVDGTFAETDQSANTNDPADAQNGQSIARTTDKKFGTYSRDFNQSENDGLGESTDDTVKNFTGTAMSICAWVKPDATTGDDFTIVGKTRNESATVNRQYELVMRTGGTVAFIINDQVDAVSTTTLSTATWYHVCGVYNGTNYQIYIDGSSEDSQAYTANINSTASNFEIGISNTVDEWDGLIDDVCIFDDDLSGAEITSIMTVGCNGVASSSRRIIKAQ